MKNSAGCNSIITMLGPCPIIQETVALSLQLKHQWFSTVRLKKTNVIYTLKKMLYKTVVGIKIPFGSWCKRH